jgi:hypothetical protein
VRVESGLTPNLRIELKRGVFLKIRVNDPQRLLPVSGTNPLDFPHLIVGVVFGKGAFLSARRSGTDSNGHDYVMPVPSGVPLHIWLFSRRVTLADGQGKALSSPAAAIPFQATLGADQNFTFRVNGKAIGAK